MMKKARGNKGFTLIEVVFSMAIVGIIAIAFLQVFSSGFIAISKSGHRAKATYEAQHQMGELLMDLELLDQLDQEPEKMSFQFQGGPAIEIDVLVIEMEVDMNGSRSTMRSFIPMTMGDEK